MSLARNLSKLAALLNGNGQVTVAGLVSDADFTINGLRVGKGAGGVGTNNALGTNALASNTTGDVNTAVGYQALNSNLGGTSNTAAGVQAMRYNTSGNNNSAFGRGSLYSNTSGANNVALGQDALSSNSTATGNTAVGHQAAYLNSTGTFIDAFGKDAAYNTTANGITAFGRAVLYANTSGTENTGIGTSYITYAALRFNTTGSYNVAIGGGALAGNTSASNNTAVGYQAGYGNTVGIGNVHIGYQAGYANGAGNNYNTFVGYLAGYAAARVSGNALNTAIGYAAGTALTNGYYNTFIGPASGSAVTTGYNNTIIGGFSGNQGGLDIRALSNYIVLSDGDGNPRGFFDNNGTFYVGNTNGLNWTTATTGGASTITLGFYYSRATGSTSGRYWFSGADNGNSYLVYNQNNTGVYISNGATSWTANSDERLKDIIEPITDAANKVSSMRSVIGKYKSDEEGTRRSFLIAQDVQAVLPEAISTHKIQGDDTDYLGVSYTDVIPLLVAAIKELKAEIDTLKGQA